MQAYLHTKLEYFEGVDLFASIHQGLAAIPELKRVR
jgi:hypothetical protein